MGFTLTEEIDTIMSKEQRIFTRMPFEHTVAWSDLNGDTGSAKIRDVSRAGLSALSSSASRSAAGLIVEFPLGGPGRRRSLDPANLDAPVAALHIKFPRAQ